MGILVVAEPRGGLRRAGATAQIAAGRAAATIPTRRQRARGLPRRGPASCATRFAARRPAARVAPDLTHLGSRRTLAAGTLPMSRGNLAAWIADPHGIKPGVNMPAVKLEPRRAQRHRRLPGGLEMSEAELARNRTRPARHRARRGRARRAAGADLGHAARPDRLALDRRPQDRRPPLPRHRLRLSCCSAALLAVVMRLQLARPESRPHRAGPLQPALHHARHDDDVPVRRAGRCEAVARLPRAADGRHAQHRLPAPERLQLLDLPVRRHLPLVRLRAQHRPRRRLVRLRAARPARNSAPASAPTSGRR